ncbi:hypothetical protein [Lysobacter antibioticus]|uniref:hypothetical protein n=1 Tax=Lysobacter antibioticus TaxID=84531 RepID=UPI001F23D568|nr:hypothetical protein [Lysobacter antibioticus]
MRRDNIVWLGWPSANTEIKTPVHTIWRRGGAQVDQRSHVLSVEGVFKPDGIGNTPPSWHVAKARCGWGAAKGIGSIRPRPLPPRRSATNCARIGTQWHALAEYRWLAVDDGGTKRGFLVGLDRDIGRNFLVGVGYNFTDFSDDLTDFDYRERGWVLNLTGRY